MRGPEQLTHVVVILRMLVGIAYHKANGTACGLTLEDTAEQLDLVSLLTGGGKDALARTATVKFALNEVHVYGDAGRHAIDDTANGCAVALAEGGQRE